MLNLSEYSVVDSHCHAFIPEKETNSFEQYFTLANHHIPKMDVFNTFIYRQVVRELSRVLNVKGTHEQIVEERKKIYKQDHIGYIKLLFEDARIETLLVDTGYPSKQFHGYSIGIEKFSKIVPSNLREIFRIDNVVYNLIRNKFDFNDAVEQFHYKNKDAVKKGAVGLKSVIAYRTGLEIHRKSEDEAKEAFKNVIEKMRSSESIREIISSKTRNFKTVLDYFVLLGIEDSVELGVPFQMHVGIGDVPSIDLRISNPILMHELINDPSVKNAKIVLTHGGYPYIEEAGFLVNTHPNVFLDLSETIPFASVGVKNKLLNLFEMAPTNKIMFGSDGYNIPELHWISSIRIKKALTLTLNELLESKEINEERAKEIANQFLSENAKRLYNL